MQETLSTIRRSFRDGPPLPRSLASLKRWLADHHMTLMTIADTPHSIALGSAIGIFFGFTPLYPLKTLLSIIVAWICRCNKLAAAVAVTIHDVLIFAMPAIYFAEYTLGCRVLGRAPRTKLHLTVALHNAFHWHTFTRVIWPALIGSLFLSIPSAIAAYVILRLLVRRAREVEGPGSAGEVPVIRS